MYVHVFTVVYDVACYRELYEARRCGKFYWPLCHAGIFTVYSVRLWNLLILLMLAFIISQAQVIDVYAGCIPIIYILYVLLCLKNCI